MQSKQLPKHVIMTTWKVSLVVSIFSKRSLLLHLASSLTHALCPSQFQLLIANKLLDGLSSNFLEVFLSICLYAPASSIISISPPTVPITPSHNLVVRTSPPKLLDGLSSKFWKILLMDSSYISQNILAVLGQWRVLRANDRVHFKAKIFSKQFLYIGWMDQTQIFIIYFLGSLDLQVLLSSVCLSVCQKYLNILPGVLV